MSLITKPTKLELEGIGALTIRPSDYVTKGGEGEIYRHGNHILKLALDPNQLVTNDTPGKVRALRSALTHPSIVVPRGLVTDSRGKVLGFHLPYVSSEPYPRLFTTTWQKQHHFNTMSATNLATTMHDVVTHTHQASALMVDGNELNWLADVKDIRQPNPFIIDVDSWQIGRFKASVVMPSIRDWHTPLSPASDWFAWGVVTFLLYTGIHPYRGTLSGYKPGELDRRMQDNASVFRPEVKLNHTVRDFTTIPGPLLDWYRSTFEDGVRTLPPLPTATGRAQTAVGRVLRAVTTSTGGLTYEVILRIPGDDIITLWPCGMVRTSSGALVEITSKRVLAHVTGTRVAVVARDHGYLIAELIGTQWQFRFVSRTGGETQLTLPANITTVVRNDNRLFIATENELCELTLHHFATPLLTIGKRWPILGNSTEWFGGIGVSDVLGAMHIVMPLANGEGVAMVRTPTLDGTRVLSGDGLGNIVTIYTIDHTGQYHRHEFAGQKDWQIHTVSTLPVDTIEPHHVTLPKGVVADIRDEGELTITVPSSSVTNVVRDRDLTTAMHLRRIANTVVYLKDGALWSLRMS